MTLSLADFLLASLLMGLGIGVDVAVTTVARAGQLTTTRLATFWVAGVSLTHTIFPMAGYLLAYFSVQLQPEYTHMVGIAAFGCIFVYLKNELKQLASPDEESQQSQLLVTLGLILAVSWDALWSGPAKSAQVIGWPEYMVWLSFLIVGLVVLLMAVASLKFAAVLYRNMEQKAYVGWLSSWIQYSVIGYFGLLALIRYTLQIPMHWWQIFILSGVMISACMALCLVSKEYKSLSARLG